MSPPGGTRAQKRHAQIRAAKERKQKIIAFGGLGVLAIVLAIQGPRFLDLVSGGSDPVSVGAPIIPETVHPKNSAGSARGLRFLKAGGDPFASRALADNDPAPGAVAAPAGAHDPFAESAGALAPAQVSAPATAPAPVPSPLPKQIVLGTPTPGAVARHGWIVVIASIQTRFGRAYAERFATRARRNGLGDVSVLNSSTRKPLRAGYFVVYTGPFVTLSAVQRSAAHVHAFGFRTAYVREILRY